MNGSAAPVIKDLVLIGGGHSHVTVLKRFGMRPIPGVQLTLISPDAHTPYSGMLPGLIAGHYDYDNAHIDLVPLCRFAGARFLANTVTYVNPQAKLVHMAGRPPTPYDILSINSGSTPDPSIISGARERVIPVKPVADFLLKWDALKQRVIKKPICRIGIIGAGAGGIELLLSAQFALRTMLKDNNIADQPEFHVVTQGDTILATHNAKVRRSFIEVMAQRNISVHYNFQVDKVSERGVHAGDKIVELDEILWVTGAEAPPWAKASGFAVDARGFIKVHPSLQSVSHPDIFATGDIAAVEDYPRPKSGVFAVRQGPPLEANLRRALLGAPTQPFKPQSAFLSLISTGGKHALASRGNRCLSGGWVWRWKDYIDRSFIRKFNDLPPMSNTVPSIIDKLPAAFQTTDIQKHLGTNDMRCGGCGAKVSSETLANVLAKLSPHRRQDIVAGLDAPDDAAIIMPPAGKQLVQTVDFFRAMIDDPFTFGQIAANHALGDIYAMGGEPQAALAIVALPFGLPDKMETLLTQMMAGAGEVLAAADCTLVGGHSSESAELGLGFSITGFIEPGEALHKTGMRPGDTLILTKPIGSGTLFAAAMRGFAKGRWLQGAISNARISSRNAAEYLKHYGATACTDVTGFGLAGHLHEMMRASRCNAELDLTAIPVLDGALETVAKGIVSSIHHDNLRIEDAIANGTDFKSEPHYQLLFDPQTAGGLLASVPKENSSAVVKALRDSGDRFTAVIGRLTSSADDTQRITLCP
ncbi:MAG: selenide, water dikinase SelD [Pseudomonadota bacterium]